MMRKFLSVVLLAIGMLCVSCSNNELDGVNSNTQVNSYENVSVEDNISGLTRIDIPDGITSVDVYNWADDSYLGTASVENGHIWIGSSDAAMTVKLYKSTAKTRASIDDISMNYIKDATVYKSEDNIISIQKAINATSGFDGNDFLNIFPAGKDNRNIISPKDVTNFQTDVLYVSNGLPFSVYPIYSCGWYDLTLGIFYYDSNEDKYEVSFWDMLTVNWKMPYAELSGNNVNDVNKFTVSKTENAEGYQITLPEGYVYGFYITSPQGGKFYCYSNENTCKEKHSINLVKDNINYLAFEDKDKGDWDINDLICYVEPQQKVIDNPNEVKKQEAIDTIKPVIIVPDGIDKIVHSKDTLDDIDVEARFDNKGHNYFRIAKPLKNNETIELDLEKLNQYCQQDDTRIVGPNDETVLYCPDNTSDVYNNISIFNKCTAGNYSTITLSLKNSNVNDYVYQLKMDLYPKNEDCFDKLVECIENRRWNDLFALKRK